MASTLPPVAPPVQRPSSAPAGLRPSGLAPSDNLHLQCQLCCESGGGTQCGSLIPGCHCPLR